MKDENLEKFRKILIYFIMTSKTNNRYFYMYRKKSIKARKSNKARKNKITRKYNLKIMKGGAPIKLNVKKFDRIIHFWENTSAPLAGNSIWYLYIKNIPRQLNENGGAIQDYHDLIRLIKEKGRLDENADKLNDSMYLEYEIEDYQTDSD